MADQHDSHHHHSHSHSGSHLGQGHHHHHSHAVDPKNYDTAFAVGIALNIIFVVTEAFYGYLANSLALMADAGHNLSDVIGLVIAWGAVWLSRKKPTTKFTYGLRRSSILSALLNAVILLVAIGAIALEAIQRFWSPHPIQTTTVIIVAAIGILINGATAMLFMRDRHKDINIRGAYLHMAADALISAGVVIVGIVISYTNWIWLDPAISLVICVIIVVGTWGLLKDSVKLSLDAVPDDVDALKVREYFEKLEGVTEVHDLHIWALSSTENALTVHLVVPKNLEGDHFLDRISKKLKKDFNIHHPTIQIENGDKDFNCELKPDDVV